MTALPAPVKRPNEFQRFVQEATGSLLPVYGQEFFTTSVYAQQRGVPINNDYLLGPGDEVIIRGVGSVDIDYRATIDREGQINIPKIGTVSLAGVKASAAESAIRVAIGKYFRGVDLSVTFGQLRGITIYVVGQARRPGSFLVSSLSTLVTALFETGGPSDNGSLRHVQVRRAGVQIAEMDLYAFLSRGEKSGDIKLMDGDVIVIPPAYGYAALTGLVEKPAVYELLGADDTVGSLLALAGGLPVVADPRRAVVERIDPSQRLPLTVEEFSLQGASLGKTVKRGDLISIYPIESEFSNAVTLRRSGNPLQRYAYRPGIKVTDLIPDRAFLMSRASIRRQNHNARDETGGFVNSIGSTLDEINWDYAVIERVNRDDLSVRVIPFNLGRALADHAAPDNMALQPGDSVSVFTTNDVRVPIANRRVVVRIEGEVRYPGVYQAAPGESLLTIVSKAGGLTSDAYLFGADFSRESVRKSQAENLEKYVRRLEQQQASSSSRTAANVTDPQAAALAQAQQIADADSRARFIQRLRDLKPTGRVTLGISPTDPNLGQLSNIRLENGDSLVIPNRPEFVELYGAVNLDAALFWQFGRTVSDYLAQAGTNQDADLDAVFVIRADGSVLSKSSSWFSGIGGATVQPGDIIVVPEKQDKSTGWTVFTRNAKDITQILANFGLGAAGIKTLRN